MVISTQGSVGEPRIIQWILDTRPLWPLPPQDSARTAKQEVEQLKTTASRALSLLSPTEQAAVLRYYHLRDAKLSLASHLLKHLIISKYAGVPWSQSTISRDANGKPYFPSPSTGKREMDFNVSHQAGLLSLIAIVGITGETKIEVGTDVVCWNERLTQDYKHIDNNGFFSWLDMHGDVFAESEVSYMKLAPVPIDSIPQGLAVGGFGKDKVGRCQWRNQTLTVAPTGSEQSTIRVPTNEVIDKKLRRFYACWCLRETYIKMTGEALLAPWLKELEILDVVAPAVASWTEEEEFSLEPGNLIRNFKILFKGEPVTNVSMELVALGKHYMVGGAIRPIEKVEELNLKLGEWEHLDLERDVLAFAESNP